MKNSKKTWLISCAGIFTIALLGYQYFGQVCTSCKPTKVAKMNAEKGNVDSSQPMAVSASAKKQQSIKVEKPAETGKHLGALDNAPQPQPGKKRYDEQWCVAKDELSESDYNFAQAQLQDWLELQGKARARSPGSSYVDDFAYPNNRYLEPYEALPLEQLQSMAVQGNDKWAMVTFVQQPYANESVKNEVAKKLLVQGASYYALEQLVISSLASAKTSVRRNGATEEAVNLVVDALAYAYWGLEQYNDGGLGPYLAITAKEPFKTKLPIELVLARSEKAIQDRLSELTNWIQDERAKAGIDIPEAPIAVQRLFANNIAVNQFISKEQMDFLRRLNITDNSRLNSTPCVEKHLAELKEKMQ